MKKRFFPTLLALCLCLGLAVPAFAAEDDFIIEGGVLVEYNGTGGNVVIPDGVTEIAPEVFYGFFSFSGLKVTLPDSIRVIGREAFCESPLSSINLPEGRFFHARCPRATPECAKCHPELTDRGDGHMVRCHLLNQ